MEKTLPGFEGWTSRKMKDCRVRACRNILRYYNIKLDTNVLFIIGRGVGFKFKTFMLSPDSKLVLWAVSGSNEFFEEDLFKNLNIKCKQVPILNSEAGVNTVLSYIDRGIPIMASFNSMYLAGNVDDRDKYRIGAGSVAPLIGYDLDEKKIVLDFYREIAGELSGLYSADMDKFLESLYVPCVPCNIKESYVLQVEEGYEKIVYDNIKGLILSGLKDICHRALQTNECGKEPEGVEGLNEFIETLEELRMYVKDTDVSEDKVNRILTIKFNYLRASFFTGSDTFYRYEFGRALVEMSQWIKSQDLEMLGKNFTEIGSFWSEFGILISNLLSDPELYAVHLDKMIKILHLIYEKEKVSFLKLENVLQLKNETEVSRKWMN